MRNTSQARLFSLNEKAAPVSLFPAFYFQCRIWYLLLFFHVVAAVYEFRLQQHYAAAFLDFFGGHAGIELGCKFIKTDAATLQQNHEVIHP